MSICAKLRFTRNKKYKMIIMCLFLIFNPVIFKLRLQRDCFIACCRLINFHRLKYKTVKWIEIVLECKGLLRSACCCSDCCHGNARRWPHQRFSAQWNAVSRRQRIAIRPSRLCHQTVSLSNRSPQLQLIQLRACASMTTCHHASVYVVRRLAP